MAKPTIQRRSFVKKLGLLSAAVLYRPFFPKASAKGLLAENNIWAEIIDYARWCPTVHNLQPHKVKILSAREATLYYDTARLLPVEDPSCRFTTAAMGIFIEHLSIAAAIYNLKVDYEILRDISIEDKGIIAFARLKLVPSEKPEVLNRELIKKRRTSRLHYDGVALGAGVIDAMKTEAAAFNHHLYSTTDKDLVNYIIDLNQKTLFEDLDSDATRGELNGLFRYDQQEAETHKDGLWAACMNFPGWLMRSVFQHHEKWNHGLKKTLIKDFYKGSFHGTTTLGWLAGDFATTPERLMAGRLLARNWLFLTSRNIYIQPFGSLITNQNAYNTMKEKLNLQGSSQLWLIFRMGYSKEPARSYRLDLKDIVIES